MHARFGRQIVHAENGSTYLLAYHSGLAYTKVTRSFTFPKVTFTSFEMPRDQLTKGFLVL